MNEHITPERLYELAQMRIVVDEPEWREHIKNCPECGVQFIQYVKNKAEADRKKGNDPVSV